MMNKRLILEELNNVRSLTDRLCGTNLILESQEEKSQKKAIALIMKHVQPGTPREEIEHVVRVELRDSVSALRSKKGGKFTLAVARFYVETRGEWSQEYRMELNRALSCIIENDDLYNSYDQNLNGESIDDLVDKTESRIFDKQEWIKNEVERIKGKLKRNTKYSIIKIDSYEQAKMFGRKINMYGKEMSGKAFKDWHEKFTPWCICDSDYTFNSYRKDGRKQFYFCLQDGFENMKIEDPNYQMSMLAILVDTDGFLDPTDGVFDRYDYNLTTYINEIELSKFLGVDFFEVFKPADQD